MVNRLKWLVQNGWCWWGLLLGTRVEHDGWRWKWMKCGMKSTIRRVVGERLDGAKWEIEEWRKKRAWKRKVKVEVIQCEYCAGWLIISSKNCGLPLWEEGRDKSTGYKILYLKYSFKFVYSQSKSNVKNFTLHKGSDMVQIFGNFLRSILSE